MKKTAIVLTGELRFEDEIHLSNFRDVIKNYDVFISTYPKYERVAKILSDNYIISDIKLPSKYSTYSRIYQWFHLNNILTVYSKFFFINFENILKIRTDINFDWSDFWDLDMKNNTMYVQTDQIFYAKTSHFIKTFQNFYFDIINVYWELSENKYIDINYTNLYESIFPIDIKTEWLTLPKTIYDKNQIKLKENIKENLEIFLSNKVELIRNLPMIVGMYNEPYGLPFSSEKCFAINCINKGLIAQSKITGELKKNRVNFNFT